jgi:hypothetical protein
MRTTRTGQSALLLFDVVALLNRENIEYAVVGAIAASVHGVVRASIDADVVLSIEVSKLKSLEHLFKGIGFATELREGEFNDPIPALLELSDAYENRVDLLAGIRGLEHAAFARAIEVGFQGEILKVLGREDFIGTKVFAGGPQDIVDAQNAISVADDALDVSLLRRIANRFGPDAISALEKLLIAVPQR